MNNSTSSFEPLSSNIQQKRINEDNTCTEQISPTKENPDWPKVEVISEEGNIKSIQIQCQCGKQMHLTCQ